VLVVINCDRINPRLPEVTVVRVAGGVILASISDWAAWAQREDAETARREHAAIAVSTAFLEKDPPIEAWEIIQRVETGVY
jgi:hypothetical protein